MLLRHHALRHARRATLSRAICCYSEESALIRAHARATGLSGERALRALLLSYARVMIFTHVDARLMIYAAAICRIYARAAAWRVERIERV